MKAQALVGVEVIGICGYARHGKDSLAQFLMRLVPGAERFAFSDAIASYARVTGQMTTRDPKLMQQVGWSLRTQNPSVWLDALYGAIADRRPPLAIVTGVRFTDEADMIRAMDGRIIRVLRREPSGELFKDPEREWNHPTERQIPDIRHDMELIANSGDLSALEAQAGSIL